MGFEFFEYDPKRGIGFHEHEDDARGEAEATLDQLNDEMADSAFSWEDHNVDEICWGIVCGRTERTSVRKATTEEQEKGFDEIASYAVRDYDIEPLSKIAELKNDLQRLQEENERLQKESAEAFVCWALDSPRVGGQEEELLRQFRAALAKKETK